jgi:tryptophan synthase alpha subunit
MTRPHLSTTTEEEFSPIVKLPLKQLDIASGGFLYCISVTGERTGLAAKGVEFPHRTQENAKNNTILAGFGISNKDTILLNKESNGIIIGNALIKIVENSYSVDLIKHASVFFGNFTLRLMKITDIIQGMNCINDVRYDSVDTPLSKGARGFS